MNDFILTRKAWWYHFVEPFQRHIIAWMYVFDLVHIKTHKFSLLIVTFICWYWINCCPYNGKNSLTNWQQLQHAHHNHDIHFHFDLIVMLMTMIIITNIKFKIVYVQGLLVQSNYVVIWKTYYDFWALQLKWLDAHNQTNAWLLFRYFVW